MSVYGIDVTITPAEWAQIKRETETLMEDERREYVIDFALRKRRDIVLGCDYALLEIGI